jgi:hypothetical protein
MRTSGSLGAEAHHHTTTLCGSLSKFKSTFKRCEISGCIHGSMYVPSGFLFVMLGIFMAPQSTCGFFQDDDESLIKQPMYIACTAAAALPLPHNA